MSDARRVAVIGAGRCAASVAVALRARGFAIAALTCARRSSAEAAAELLGGAPIAASNAEAAAAAPIVLIGVPDRHIEAVAEEIARAGIALEGRVFLHLAGVLDASALAALAAGGAATGSLHPLQTFPERVAQPAWLSGVYFAVEGDAPATAAGRALVAAIGGHVLTIAPGQKALYHAAASVASNQLTALLDYAHRLLAEAGCGDGGGGATRQALMPLVLTTLANVDSLGGAQALTGPIVRGDEETVVRHLLALPAGARETYASYGRVTLELARRSGRLEEPVARAIAARLETPRTEVVCSLRASSLAGLRERAARRPPGSRVEYRLDWLEEPIPPELSGLEGADILAVRPGTAATPELARAWLAHQAPGRDVLVDLPLGMEAGFPPERTIISWHGPAAGALAAARAIASRRPAVGKVVIEECSAGDLALVPEVARLLRLGSPRVAAFASGEGGIPTRILPRHFGSDWSYACFNDDERTGDAQLPASELVDRYGVPGAAWDRGPCFGLVGHPIGHSLSPRLFNGLLGAPYAAFPTRELEPIVALAPRIGLSGLSVTMPLKEEAYRLCQRHGPEAAAAASVNTILFEDGRLGGENTDAPAVAETAAALLPLAGARALVLGAGGSARSAVVGLRAGGAEVVLVARNPERARAAAERLDAGWAARAAEVTWDLLVHATPVGMGQDEQGIAIDPELLRGKAVIDLVYHPRETRLLREARARGLSVAPGLEVFLRQAQRQIELFGGKRIPIEALRRRVDTP